MPQVNDDESCLATDDPTAAVTNGLTFVWGPCGSCDGRLKPPPNRVAGGRRFRLDAIFTRYAFSRELTAARRRTSDFGVCEIFRLSSDLPSGVVTVQ